jgi:hypothetical protein
MMPPVVNPHSFRHRNHAPKAVLLGKSHDQEDCSGEDHREEGNHHSEDERIAVLQSNIFKTKTKNETPVVGL